MIQGINYITDEKGKQTGIILDLISLNKHKIKASEVIEELSDLQLLIDQADAGNKKSNNWDIAKEKLKDLNRQKDE